MKRLRRFRLKEKSPRVKIGPSSLDRKIYAITEKIQKASVPVLILAFVIMFLASILILQSLAPQIIIAPKAFIPYEVPDNPEKADIAEANLRMQEQRHGLQQYEAVTGKQRNLVNMTFLILLVVSWRYLIEYRRIYIPLGWGRN